MVVGTDIAELLMKNRKFYDIQGLTTSSSSSINASETYIDNDQTPSLANQYNDKYLTDKFREYLIYGSDKEALGNLFSILIHEVSLQSNKTGATEVFIYNRIEIDRMSFKTVHFRSLMFLSSPVVILEV